MVYMVHLACQPSLNLKLVLYCDIYGTTCFSAQSTMVELLALLRDMHTTPFSGTQTVHFTINHAAAIFSQIPLKCSIDGHLT